MSDVRFIETREFNDEFLKELRSGGSDLAELQETVTEPIICDYSNVDNILRTQEMRQASLWLREQPPPSTLRKRVVANFGFSPDELFFDFSSQWMPGVVSNNNGIVANKKIAVHNITGIYNGIITLGADGTLTFLKAGVYRFRMSLNMAFYPATLEQSQVANGYKAVSNGTTQQTRAQAYLVMGTTQGTRYEVLSDILFTRSDFEKGRVRMLTGEATLTVAANTTVAFHMGRGPAMGTFTKADSTTFPEVLGLKKTRYVIASGQPNRDISNYAEIIQLA